MTSDDMGPLPQADHNSELQRASIKALTAILLPMDDLVFRGEPTEDYGVDGSLEVKVADRMTNIRSQVQMKSTGEAKANSDGSISLEVNTSNLNYLLNGPCPLYVLYDASNHDLWYVWAQEEQKKIQSANPHCASRPKSH